jgi:hypothetical protein
MMLDQSVSWFYHWLFHSFKLESPFFLSFMFLHFYHAASIISLCLQLSQAVEYINYIFNGTHGIALSYPQGRRLILLNYKYM